MGILAIFSLLAIIEVANGILWNDLRVTWGWTKNEHHFVRLPRTSHNASEQGWFRISDDCENEGRFSGIRYKIPTDDSLNLLFDVNGFIAGIQALLPHDEVIKSGNPYRFDLQTMYQNETIRGQQFLVLTAYFVPTDTICSKGRTLSEFEAQGTGSGLWFQNGATADNLIKMASNRARVAEEGWTNCNCFMGMGLHNMYRVDQWQKDRCTRMRPAQVTFDLKHEELHGFVFMMFGRSSTKTRTRFEHPNPEAFFGVLAPRVPPCILEHNLRFGTSTMHIYMVDEPWRIRCNGRII